MSIEGALKAARHRLDDAVGRRGLILLYHRVADLPSDPWELSVAPARFAEQMAVLRRAVPVIPLARLATRSSGPRRCVAVTFDDGYADNLHAAVPLLDRHEVPATVFVTTGAIGGQEFWWDRLERILLRPGVLPEQLSLIADGQSHEFSLGSSVAYDAEAFAAHRGWVATEEPPTVRHAVFLAVWRLLRSLSTPERDRILGDVAAWAGSDNLSAAEGRAVTAAELGMLATHPLIELGAHTATHPRLAALPPAERRREIVQSKKELEAFAGTPVTSFAYPYGKPTDYGAETPDVVRDAGFTRACATLSGTVRPSTDSYQLPRVYVPDCDGAQFEALLAGWLRGRAR